MQRLQIARSAQISEMSAWVSTASTGHCRLCHTDMCGMSCTVDTDSHTTDSALRRRSRELEPLQLSEVRADSR